MIKSKYRNVLEYRRAVRGEFRQEENKWETISICRGI